MLHIDFNNKLPQKFYLRHSTEVAPDLLGKFLVRRIGKIFLVGKIVEVEAYDGSIDQAAHTFIGKTKRNEVMFLPGGLLYVYFTYGMHYCCNIVTGEKDRGQAVLIRAIEPILGIDTMIKNRFGKRELSLKDGFENLTNGPAKVCSALKITKKDNGTNLMGNDIFLLNNNKTPVNKIVITTRIGIKKSVDLPWRFYIKDNLFVSKK
ncbi:DNA-3-methyladenine glycosylase [Melioribacteraceae bacterium 4301-Me]|uniref:DNA-3-methyladenine glycosylase n=1 Tax=Pyranulibacter aquaticus TaxID=3163344 RepID=UPI003596C083